MLEQATSEKDVEEHWGVIMSICDKAGKSPDDAKNYLRAIIKRLYNTDPHIGVKAVTLLDACVKNSGKTFHIEVASREFENDFTRLMSKAHPTVAKKLRECLKRWAENEFKSDRELNLIPSLYTKLKAGGLDFASSEPVVKKVSAVNKDPNVVESQEEEEQILKAIELSLKDSSSPRKAPTASSASLYPSVNMASTNQSASKEPRKVRALYDFEAAEDNELTFSSGEILFVLDDSDPNWWKGSNHRGEGLFPANFVTADLSVEPEKFLYEKAKKMVQFKESTDVKVLEEKQPETMEISEEKIDRLLHLLHEADPTNPENDTEEMLNLEREVNAMGPLIDTELERVDRKHAQLTQLSADLVEALSLYHALMREPQLSMSNKVAYGFPPAAPGMHYSGTLPPMHLMQQHGPPPHQQVAPVSSNDRMHPHQPPFMNSQPGGGPGQVPPHPHGIPFQQHIPQSASAGHIAGAPPGAPHPPHHDDRRHEAGPAPHPQHQAAMHYMGPGVPNFTGGPAGAVLPPPQFQQPSVPSSQTSLQNGPHFVTSSTHVAQ
ncbi:unnamed protein product [Acanthoscelides obtectus]|uniref:Signal transducing adapter molecule 1 n=1 Tax=Acanthoscelides obtectus TaxID=200917 RepID=A0A9P0LI19_ACAOB|nr:unnamed protein product [Acanthoscelides obtectus]CAK1676986.1 Signal transducing adapter molecule 1 [Acanthoscelides obtectus]